MEDFGIYTEEEMLDRHIGKRGTEARERFEKEISSSGDAWFDDPENIRIVKHGIKQIEKDEGAIYTVSELKERLGV